MKTMIKTLPLLAVLATPVAAQAQRLNPAVVAVVDTERVIRECNACKTANTQLQGQIQQLQTLQQQLASPLQTEAQALDTAVKGLNGKEPDAALKQRIQAFQTRQNSANQQLQTREQQIRSTQANVGQQINAKLRPIFDQVLAARGATVLVDRSALLAASPSVDVTNDVLAQLNQQLPTVSVTPLPQQQQQPQQPAGR